MKNLVIYTAFHQQSSGGSAGTTCLGIEVRYGTDKKRWFKDETNTYGVMWLMWVTRLLNMIKPGLEEHTMITLVSGQDDCVKMANKVERCLIKCFTKQAFEREQVEKIVYQESKWRHLPNNDLYVDLVLLLLELHQTKRISLAVSNQAGSITAKLYKDARTKLEPSWKPKKTKKKPNLKLVVNN